MMSDNDSGSTALLFIAVFAYVVCTVMIAEVISIHEIDSAVEKCASNSGVRFIEFDYARSYVVCNNGGEFKLGRTMEVES